MTRISVTASIVAIAILGQPPVSSFAQSGGGGRLVVEVPAVHRLAPAARRARQRRVRQEQVPAGVNGVPSGPANAGGQNNSVYDPSGAGNAEKVVAQPPPGTNSAGTANSSGASMTTGSARPAPGGTAAAAPQAPGDVAIDKEDKVVDQKLKSICRGC